MPPIARAIIWALECNNYCFECTLKPYSLKVVWFIWFIAQWLPIVEVSLSLATTTVLSACKHSLLCNQCQMCVCREIKLGWAWVSPTLDDVNCGCVCRRMYVRQTFAWGWAGRVWVVARALWKLPAQHLIPWQQWDWQSVSQTKC